MEMMEAEITIDADVHSEITVWTQGWDNEDSKGIAEAVNDLQYEAAGMKEKS